MRLPLGMAGPDGSLALHRPAAGAAIRNLNPGYFALVMATGIVSRAVGADGSARLSGILLALTIVCYVVLVVAYGWRLVGYRREFLADLADRGRRSLSSPLSPGRTCLARGWPPMVTAGLPSPC